MKKDHDQAPQHNKFALGQVDDLGHIVDNIETKSDHGIDTANSQTGYEVLKQLACKRDLFHRYPGNNKIGGGEDTTPLNSLTLEDL